MMPRITRAHFTMEFVRSATSAILRRAFKAGLLISVCTNSFFKKYYQRFGGAQDPLEVFSISPHNVSLYELALKNMMSQGVEFITSKDLYGDVPLDKSKKYILLRHDIDYAPDQIELLTDVERKLGVRSDIYVILGENYYDVEPYLDSLNKLRSDGFVLGLHTLAPIEDDFYSCLRNEIDVFTKYFDVAPEYFTIHGPPAPPERPDNWEERRAKFMEKVAMRMASFGFLGTHNNGNLDRWIEDSGFGGEYSYLQSNWFDQLPNEGEVVGVLTHPCHWVSWKPRWEYNENARKESLLIQSILENVDEDAA